MKTPTLQTVRVCLVPDDSPDLSWLGEYSNTWKEGAIDRKERGDWSSLEYRYFLPSGIRGNTPEQNEEDYEQMERYGKTWEMLGVVARAVVTIPFPSGGSKATTFQSSLWGIESDSDPAYLEEMKHEVLEELRLELEAYGVGLTEWETMKDKALQSNS